MSKSIVSNYKNVETEVFVYDESEVVSNNMIQNNNFFEIGFLDYVAENYNDQDEILDVGANIGNHSLFLLNF